MTAKHAHLVARALLVAVASAAMGAPAPAERFAAAAGRAGAPEARDGDRERRQRMVDRARAYWRALPLIGFRGVCLVAQDGRPLLLEGAGGISATATFDLASIAKSLTAIAVLRLAQGGKLKMGDSLARFFPDAPADKKEITVDQLLTHTGGLGNATGDTAAGVKDRAQAVRMILATPLVGKPGARYTYSNDGYTLLAAIMEVVTARRWEDVMRAEILRPAGMEHTIFLGDPLPSGRYAMARAAVPLDDSTHQADWGAKGGAGILSTAEDLLRLINAVEDGRLLGPKGALELGTSYAPKDEFLQYSRAFRLRNLPGRGPEWSHGGADTGTGHYSWLEYYPKSRLLLVVLALDSEDLEAQAKIGLGKVWFGEEGMTMPPARPGRPAVGFTEPLALAGERLQFTIEPGSPSNAATLLPQNAEATSFIAARSGRQKAELDECVTETRKLLDEVAKLAAADGPAPAGARGRTVEFWRERNREDGPVQEIAVLGAVPNWVDSEGGTLSWVRVRRARKSTVFRLYWSGKTLLARGGQAFPNPAPIRLIDFGGGEYGGWNPSLGAYLQIRLPPANGSARQAILRAGGRSATLTVVPSPSVPAPMGTRAMETRSTFSHLTAAQ